MDYYVYVHRKATTGEIFYVGKGRNARAYEFGRNAHWNNVANKHGYVVEMVYVGLQEWYAFELEMQLIALYGRKDLDLGNLVNLTDGGEGFTRETAILAGKKGGATCVLNKAGVLGRSPEKMREDGLKGGAAAVIIQRQLSTGLFGLTHEDRVAHGKDLFKNKIGFHKEEHRGKGARVVMVKKIGLFGLSSEELSRNGSKGGSTTNKIMYTCAGCGMVTNVGCMTRHQKKHGHSGVLK